MPDYERLPVKVSLVIEVDGHVLTFTQEAIATGGRGSRSENLEHNINGVIDTSIARVTKKADAFVHRAWPPVPPPAP